LKNLKPKKLKVEFRERASKTEPVIGRKYTLTHSDATADLYLTIGPQFAYDRINAMRDEVLAEWRSNNGQPYLYVYVYLDDRSGSEIAKQRDAIFRRELPLALEAIMHGDRDFFSEHPGLDYAQIWIHFDSENPEYSRFEYQGRPLDYK